MKERRGRRTADILEVVYVHVDVLHVDYGVADGANRAKLDLFSSHPASALGRYSAELMSLTLTQGT